MRLEGRWNVSGCRRSTFPTRFRAPSRLDRFELVSTPCRYDGGRSLRAYHYSGELRSLEHPKAVRDLIQSLLGPDRMAKAMRAHRRKPPRVFALSEGLRPKRSELPAFHHGSTLSNLEAARTGGIGFASGEDGINSGFFLTIDFEKRAEKYGESAVGRMVSGEASPEQKRALLEGNVDALTPAHAELTLRPDTRVVDLSEGLFEKNKAHEWFTGMISKGKGPELLRGVVSDDFIAKYFDDKGKPVGGFSSSKQFFALLFGAEAVIVSPKYEARQFDELVLLQPDAVSKLEIVHRDPSYAEKVRESLKRELAFQEHPATLESLSKGARVETTRGEQGRVIGVFDGMVKIESLNKASSWVARPHEIRVIEG